MNKEVAPYEFSAPPNSGNYKVGTMAEAMRLAEQRSIVNAEMVSAESVLDDIDPDPYGYVQEIEEETGLNILEPRWKALPDDPQWIKRVRARARRHAVARLFLHGFKVPEIAQRVKVSETTIVRDINNIQSEWRKSYLADIEEIAAKDMDRLEYYLTKLSSGIDRGDTKSIMAAVEIIKERGNVLGYRQGMQVDIEQYVRQVAEANGYDPERAVAMAQRISIRFKP